MTVCAEHEFKNMQKHYELRPDLVERILERFGMSQHPSIDEESLTSICRNWYRHIPFDNILKRVRTKANKKVPLPGGSPAEFFETWMKTGAGGTCWAGNGGLCTLLQTLGFPANLGISMMVPTSLAPVNGDAPKHGTVVVNFGYGPLIVDATIMPPQPIRLKTEEYAGERADNHTHQIDGLWHLQWKPLVRPAVYCRIEQLDVSTSEFEFWHEHSRDLSKFNQGVIIRRAGENRLDGIVRGHRATRYADGTEVSASIDRATLQKHLIEEFAISEELVFGLPDDEFE
jgi:N-hydroxyarylamine O-acetyltransferase